MSLEKDRKIGSDSNVSQKPLGTKFAAGYLDVLYQEGDQIKKRVLLLSIFILAFISIQIYSQRSNSETTDQEELRLILKKCAEYCEKLSHTVLDFICHEKITEEINTFDERLSQELAELSDPTIAIDTTYPEKDILTYVYDYQMIRKDNMISDRRILLRENGEKRKEVDALLKTRRYKHHNIIFGPIALLAELWQPQYEYKIIQRKKIKGDRVVVIEAIPNDKMTSSNPYGKVWIREDDFSIVKIEWDQGSLGNLDVLKKDARRFESTPKVEIYAEYGYEKNGIRFPNKYSIIETYFRDGIKNFIRSRIVTTYKNYKFFTVESAVKY